MLIVVGSPQTEDDGGFNRQWFDVDFGHESIAVGCIL